MSTISIEQQEAIRKFLEGRHIPVGLGNEHEACSIASINLALYGKLTDEIPACMSKVIGYWTITMQDSLPDDLRNSAEWRELLPLAAGTGREHETKRSQILLDWMWDVVLPQLQPLADRLGFGREWKAMTKEKTEMTAYVAAGAPTVAYADMKNVAALVAAAAGEARAATIVANARAACLIADAASLAARAVARSEEMNFWQSVDPIAVLRKLIEVGSSH